MQLNLIDHKELTQTAGFLPKGLNAKNVVVERDIASLIITYYSRSQTV